MSTIDMKMYDAAVARIAELEAERDKAERERFSFAALNTGLANRIAELEAEGGRLNGQADRDKQTIIRLGFRITELEAKLSDADTLNTGITAELKTVRELYDESKAEIIRILDQDLYCANCGCSVTIKRPDITVEG